MRRVILDCAALTEVQIRYWLRLEVLGYIQLQVC